MTAAKPRVYTLCGSSRFPDAFAAVTMHLSARGHIAIGPGMAGHADEPRGAQFLTSSTEASKRALDELHFRKIDVSDAIFVINVGGYVGTSTRREITYALETGKTVDWLFPDDIPDDILEVIAANNERDRDVRYIGIAYWRRAGAYEWDGTRHRAEEDAVADLASLDCDAYVGMLHGDKLVTVRPGGESRIASHEREAESARLIDIASIAGQIGLELMTP